MTRKKPEHAFRVDAVGNPTGGYSVGPGYSITWQNGIEDENGAHIEDVIQACIERLRFFQDSKFACRENSETLVCLEEALAFQEDRTRNRRERGVESSYVP